MDRAYSLLFLGRQSCGKIISIRRTADRRMIKDKEQSLEQILVEHLGDLKGPTGMILNNHASVLVRIERLSPPNKAGRESSRNKLVKENRSPHKIKRIGEVDKGKDCPRACLEFGKPI